MTGRMFAALLLSAGLVTGSAVLGKPATQPTTLPSLLAGATTRPSAKLAAATAEKASAKSSDKFPSPSELLAKLKSQKAEEDKLLKVAYLDLDEPVAEKAPAFSLFGQPATTLQSLIERLHKARDDKSLRGVLITLGNTSFSLSQAQEIRGALVELRHAGKRTFVYSDSYDTAAYTAATGATDICLLGGGEMMMPGVGLETMFYKGLFDKLGVEASYVQIGEYKGAQEPYINTEASKELKGELNKLVDALYTQIVDGIAKNRNLSPEQVKASIDECIITARSAKDRKLVDHLTDMDGLRSLIKDELGNDINLLGDYGKPQQQKLDFSNPLALFQMLARKPTTDESAKPQIAIIHAEGVIVDGPAEEGLFGGGGNVGSDDMRKAFRMASRDDNIKAIVLRIDSPGGSALASEVMWQAARHAADNKPLIISIGGMAASGGYYLASAGDYIIADPTAIVGSIGVVGGKFVLKGLFDKLGLTTESFTRGRNADLFSENQPFTDRQRRMVTNWMKETYDQFTERVMFNRKDKIKDIDQVARGRIFIAKQAKELGMVDELGGIEEAIAFAAKDVGLKVGEFEVKQIPAPRSLMDLFNGGGGSTADPDAINPFKPHVHIDLLPDSILRAVSPSMRKLIGQQLQVIQLLQNRPVMLVAPYVLTVK